jgi:hypothetical protein
MRKEIKKCTVRTLAVLLAASQMSFVTDKVIVNAKTAPMGTMPIYQEQAMKFDSELLIKETCPVRQAIAKADNIFSESVDIDVSGELSYEEKKEVASDVKDTLCKEEKLRRKKKAEEKRRKKLERKRKQEEKRRQKEEERRIQQIFAMGSNVPNEEPDCKSEVKTHMAYQKITCKSSMQYKLEAYAETDKETGIRMVDGCYLIAVGSFYSDYIGQKLLITMESGAQILCMTGDFKSDAHTDPTNRYHVGGMDHGKMRPGDGSVIEFVMDDKAENYNIPNIFDGKIFRIDRYIEQ